jgi:uncharacterized protein
MENFSNEQKLIIDNAKKYISEIFKEDSSGHDYEHSLRVYKNAMDISSQIIKQQENIKLNIFIIGLSALLHDIDDYKTKNYNKDNPFQNLDSFIKENKITNENDIKLIKEIISEVSFKAGETKTPKTLEGKIVQDADRLDAIGAIGIARAFAFGGSRKRKLYDEENINELAKRNFEPFDMTDVTFEQYKNNKTDTVTHFYEKLLKLESMINTEQGKIIAKERTEVMKKFLKQLFEEIIDK